MRSEQRPSNPATTEPASPSGPSGPTLARSAAAHVQAMAETAGGTANMGTGKIALGNVKGDRLEVAVAIGTDPATTFSAIVPAPPEVEEFMIAGFLRGKPVEIEWAFRPLSKERDDLLGGA